MTNHPSTARTITIQPPLPDTESPVRQIHPFTDLHTDYPKERIPPGPTTHRPHTQEASNPGMTAIGLGI